MCWVSGGLGKDKGKKRRMSCEGMVWLALCDIRRRDALAIMVMI